MTSRRSFLAALVASGLAPGGEKSSGVSLQIILVRTRPEAEEILKELEAGQPFASLAKQFSVVPSGRWGGYIGELELAALPPLVRDALKGVGPDQVTSIIETPSGFLIIKVLSGIQAGVSPSPDQTGMGAGGAQLGYQPVTDVSGLPQAELFFERFPKPSHYQQDLKVNCQARLNAVFTGIDQLQNNLAAASKVSPDLQTARQNIVHIHYELAQMFSYQGNVQKAVEHFQTAYEMAPPGGEYKMSLEKLLGIAELRRGETENCVHHHNVQMCILPLSSEGRHTVTSGSEAAAKHFLSYLDQNPQDLEAKWLLNIAYMTLGRYPDVVPTKHRIAPAVFESKEDIGRFRDVAPSLGLNVFGMAGSVVIDDFDNDGFLDIVVSDWDACAGLRYFHNNGDGSFSDRSSEAGLSGQLGGLNLIQTDYNNDGWLDLLVLRGAWQTPVRKSLLRNNGDGTFTDVTFEAGLAIPATSTQAAVWTDFDNDGLIDLFIGNEHAPAQLFHNNGDGTFTDVARSAGVDRIAFSKAAVAGDYDNDGFPDVYVSNYGEENFLYHNNRNGTFTNVARTLGVEKPIFSFPAWFFDYNNDGWLDIFASSFIHSVSEVVRSYLGLTVKAEAMRLYENSGGSLFRDVSREVGLERVFMPMGSNFGDVDNDGFLDFYLGTGDPSYASLVPNVLFKNKKGKYFVDITGSSGTGCLQKGHGVAIAAIFNDGQPCIFEKIGGASPGDKYYCALFRNPGTCNNWISIKLVGAKTNRAAVGARIKLTLDGAGEGPQFIYRDVNSGGSFGGSPLQQHVGLGKASRIDMLEIWWPTSKSRQVFRDVVANQFIEVHEFAKDFVKLERRTVKL